MKRSGEGANGQRHSLASGEQNACPSSTARDSKAIENNQNHMHPALIEGPNPFAIAVRKAAEYVPGEEDLEHRTVNGLGSDYETLGQGSTRWRFKGSV